MRVSPGELQAVHRAGMLTRYSLFGPVVFVLADLPAAGLAGTGLDQPCLTEHLGIVMRGSFAVHHEDGRSDTFEEGTAFYVPAGPPTHSFSATPRSVVGGFAATAEPPDVSPESLAAQGYDVVDHPRLPVRPPATVTLAGTAQPFRRPGAIDVEGSVMGPWIFMRTTLGPRSGYTGGWCDLPHWGLVLDGEVLITYAGKTELLSLGDAFLAPPGHRFSSPDGATVIDYTPIDTLGTGRVSRWRQAAIDRALRSAGAVEGLDAVRSTWSRPARSVLRRGLAPG